MEPVAVIRVSNIAPLLAVAIQFGAPSVPSFKKPTIEERQGEVRTNVQKGISHSDWTDLAAVVVPKLAWIDKKACRTGI